MPSWTSGFIQCKDRYRNQSQVLEVARGYVDRGLPISMIVIDWFHWEQMGDFALNPACWPDPQGMVDELTGAGIELMTTFWPFVGLNVSKHWGEYVERGYLATNLSSGAPDSMWWYNTVRETSPRAAPRSRRAPSPVCLSLFPVSRARVSRAPSHARSVARRLM